MKKKLKALSRTCLALACAITVFSSDTVIYATDSVESLEKQTSNLEDKLNSLNQDLDALSSDISELASKIEDTDASVKKAELDLAAARVNEEMQYDAMKKRIKYMYEAGNTSLLEIIFSSQSMGEFLNNTEFVRNVTEYDREKLKELQEVHQNVKAKEVSLKEEQEKLQKMKTQLDDQKEALNSAISATSSELASSSDALAKAKEARAAAEDALKEKEQSQQHSSGSSGNIIVPPTTAETNDLVLFAALLQCEAGSSDYDALLAVATVVMNRVESNRYPNTLYGVIYQKGQFSPTWNGSLNRVLNKGPASLCYQVAQDALGGARLAAVKDCYSFRASWSGHAGVLVGGNVFF